MNGNDTVEIRFNWCDAAAAAALRREGRIEHSMVKIHIDHYSIAAELNWRALVVSLCSARSSSIGLGSVAQKFR